MPDDVFPVGRYVVVLAEIRDKHRRALDLRRCRLCTRKVAGQVDSDGMRGCLPVRVLLLPRLGGRARLPRPCGQQNDSRFPTIPDFDATRGFALPMRRCPPVLCGE